MFRDSVAVRGLSEIESKLKNLPIKVRKTMMRKALRAGGKIILSAAREEAPVRTGLLQSQIKLRVHKNKKGYMSIRVGTGSKGNPGPAFYSSFVELGYKHRGGKQIPANPFLKRASDKSKDQAGQATTESLQQQIEESVRA